MLKFMSMIFTFLIHEDSLTPCQSRVICIYLKQVFKPIGTYNFLLTIVFIVQAIGTVYSKSSYPPMLRLVCISLSFIDPIPVHLSSPVHSTFFCHLHFSKELLYEWHGTEDGQWHFPQLVSERWSMVSHHSLIFEFFLLSRCM